MGDRASGAIARAEIIAVAGPEALAPLIEDPHDPRWDLLLGAESADFFKDYVPTAAVQDPVKELAASGVNTPRDVALVGIYRLMTLSGFGVRSMLDCWSNMRTAEPPMPLPFQPDISSIVRLSLGDLGRVPIVVATRRWLPERAYRKYGSISVARGYELIDSGPRSLPVPPEARGQFMSSVSKFGKAFMEESKRQRTAT